MKMKPMMKKLLSNLKTKLSKVNWFDFYIHFMMLFIYALILATFLLLATHTKELHEKYNSGQGPTIIAPKVYVVTETLEPPTSTPIPTKTLEPKIIRFSETVY